MLAEFPYDRTKATAYANYWAYRRNPQYYSFSGLGGDCTNFVSQCMFAGSGIMNYTPTYGWYYLNINDRAPAWTGVVYLFNFLTTNKGVGPYGHEVDIAQVEPGDVVQFILGKDDFEHTAIVMKTGATPAPDNILIAAHSNDCNCRQVDTYEYQSVRFLHIDGVRYEKQG